MLWAFLEVAFVTIVMAWVLAKVLSAIGRWSDRHSKLERDIEIDPTKPPDERDSGTLGLVVAMVLLFLLLMPNAVTSNGQSISLLAVSDSMRVSKDVGTLATFVGAWRTEEPLEFWGFFAGFSTTVVLLFRRSPALLGVAVVASLFTLWLKMNAGISAWSF